MMRGDMNFATLRASLVALPAALSACAPPPPGDELPRLNLHPGSLTVSGLSSGGYMATQYQVAFSADVAGAAVIAAGPWLCAQGILTRALRDCLKGETGGPDVRPLVAALRASAALGAVDDPSGLAADRVWLFHGAQDDVVGAAVADSLLRFYKVFVPLEQLRYVTRVPAAHGFPTIDEGGACGTGDAPWILACGYDAAGEMLNYLYGGLAAPSAKVTGTLRTFGQARYVARGAHASMAETGFLFVPKDCADGAACRVHVAFHGCGQGVDTLGRSFARQAGYERWADANRMVVLYPQAAASTLRPLNPRGCWDWWGYSGADYAAKQGAQLSAVHRMLEALGAT
jgi:hypothetical protein